MGAITRIAWCDATFNPWVGCLRVSTACDRCYAAALSWRYGWRDGGGDGPDARIETFSR
jgi:protein gp37